MDDIWTCPGQFRGRPIGVDMVAVRRWRCAAMVCALVLIPASAWPQSTPVRPPTALSLSRVASYSLDRWTPSMLEAAKKFGVPVAWIRAAMRVESGGHTMLNGVPITSSAGAMGLMQMMPDTYTEMQIRYDLGPDPYDPHDNILAGAGYLREMYLRYGYRHIDAVQQGPRLFLHQYWSFAEFHDVAAGRALKRAGFTGTSWPVTSQSSKYRTAAKRCFAVRVACARVCNSTQGRDMQRLHLSD
jgi:hypothetical protein